MNVLEKTRELGEALYQCPEFNAMKEAQAAMETDPVSAQLLKEMAELEADIRATMEKPEMEMFVKPKMERYQKLQQKAGEDPRVQDYQKAAGAFQQLMGQVNSIINFFLTGETQEEGGCTGNCATCHACAHEE